MQSEQILIQKISSRPSTEELIFFIAQDDAMTSACAELHKKIAGTNKKELKKINLLCQRYHISVPYLARELDHVQNIFAPRKNFTGDHKILGLSAGASNAEVKQAYRKLSIQYHPDTSGEDDTAKFIKITKAYQRIINSPDKEENPGRASSSSWSYRKKTPPRPQRKKKYIYLFSFIGAVLLLIIVNISMHYQKRAMLSNISMKKTASSGNTSTVSKEKKGELASLRTEQAPIQQQPASSLTAEVSPEKTKAQKDVDRVLPLAPQPTGPTIQNHPPLATSSQKDLSQEAPQKNLPTNSFSAEKSGLAQIEKSRPTSSLLPEQPKSNKVTTRENLEQDRPVADKTDEVDKEAGQKEKEIFSTINQERVSAKTEQKALQQEDNALFSSEQYQKAVIIKPAHKKIRAKKSSVKKTQQAFQKIHQESSVLDALRAFITSYTAAYMSRDIQRLAPFFTKNASENGVPFSRVREQYKDFFTATQAIKYHIDLLGTDIQNKGATATLTGRFHAQLTYSSKKTNSNSGTITFFLAKKKSSYKITALTYQLDPKRP